MSGAGSVVRERKVALQFVTAKGEIIWIWHDELRYGGQGGHAALDTNGDGLADLAVTGTWNGCLYGVARWQPIGTASTATQADRAYPTRPDITAVSQAMGRAGASLHQLAWL